jgi:P27 family predicted phage terminase small subunit
LRNSVRPPEHLSADSKRLFRSLQAEYGIDDRSGVLLLTTAMEARDRMKAATATIEAEGQSISDRFGQTKAHPLLVVERDARAAMLSALKALHLDVEPVRPPGRPGGR